MSKQQPGTGSIMRQHITPDGEVILKVVGQDATTGHWAIMEVAVPWAEWQTRIDVAHTQREKEAQGSIW